MPPVPVEISAPAVALGRLYFVEPFEIPGIALADAFDAGDQFGSPFSIPVPKAGAIVNMLFHDLDNEGINKEVWLFRGDPLAGVAASDAAFALSDKENPLALGVITFDSWKTATNGQLGKTSDLPQWYVTPTGLLYFSVKTSGADSIAAGSVPRISMTIERYDDQVG